MKKENIVVSKLYDGFSITVNGEKKVFSISDSDIEKAINLALFVNHKHNVTSLLHCGVLIVSIFSQDWELLMTEMIEFIPKVG